jgi:hypothetical protein
VRIKRINDMPNTTIIKTKAPGEPIWLKRFMVFALE